MIAEREIHEESDPCASSYWREGASYGDPSGPQSLLQRLIHWMLQTPYRRMGRAFPSFRSDLTLGYALVRRQNRQFTLDILRHVLTLSFLKSRGALPSKDRVLVIGDGFGTMASLVLMDDPRARVMSVNLDEGLELDREYIARAGEFYPRWLGIRARHAEFILQHSSFGLAINIASMQEMDTPEIAKYFRLIRRHKAILYCANRLSKKLPDGTITRFKEYPWGAHALNVDESCPWHQSYYANRFPFYFRYEGTHWHRLARLV